MSTECQISKPESSCPLLPFWGWFCIIEYRILQGFISSFSDIPFCERWSNLCAWCTYKYLWFGNELEFPYTIWQTKIYRQTNAKVEAMDSDEKRLRNNSSYHFLAIYYRLHLTVQTNGRTWCKIVQWLYRGYGLGTVESAIKHQWLDALFKLLRQE